MGWCMCSGVHIVGSKHFFVCYHHIKVAVQQLNTGTIDNIDLPRFQIITDLLLLFYLASLDVP